HGIELWTSDGTFEGTFMVLDYAPGESSSSPHGLIAYDAETCAFAAYKAETGMELCTYRVKSAEENFDLYDVRPGKEGSNPADLTVVHMPDGSTQLFFT